MRFSMKFNEILNEFYVCFEYVRERSYLKVFEILRLSPSSGSLVSFGKA